MADPNDLTPDQLRDYRDWRLRTVLEELYGDRDPFDEEFDFDEEEDDEVY